MKKKFNIGKAFSFGFHSLRKYPLVMVPIGIQTAMTTLFVFVNGSTVFMKSPDPSHIGSTLLLFLASLLFLVIFILIQAILQIGIIRIGLKLIKGEEKPNWKEVFRFDWSLIGNFIATLAIYALLMVTASTLILAPSLLLFVYPYGLPLVWKYVLLFLLVPTAIPVIFIYITFYFVGPVIVETKEMISQVFKRSANLTKGIKWYIFGFSLLTLGASYFMNQYLFSFQKMGMVWLYYVSFGVFTFLWTCLFVLVPIYIYKDLGRQLDRFDQASIEMNQEELAKMEALNGEKAVS